MPQEKQVIALAGCGELGRYICDELSSDGRFTIVVLTRQPDLSLRLPNTTTHQTDYTLASFLPILTTTAATALISTLRCPDPLYLPIHTALLAACQQSPKCKRFIPSEWGGNIDDTPLLPRAYGMTRVVLREMLRGAEGVRSTLVNHGWCMEYFLAEGCSRRKALDGEFPVDVPRWSYVVRGTGDEVQAWTCGRDVARAVRELLFVDDWEPVIYLAGQWGTFNEAASVLEAFYGRPLQRSNRTVAEINSSLEKYKNQPDSSELAIAEAEEWTVTGATACPKEKTLRQREKYFKNVEFLSLREMLGLAEREGFV